MSKTLDAALAAILATDEKMPVHLYRLTLTNVTLRFAAAKQDVEYPAGGAVWTAKAVKHEEPRFSIGSHGVRRGKIYFANGDQTIWAYHRQESLVGKKLEALRVYREDLSSEDYQIDLMAGYITAVNWDYRWFCCELAMGDTLRQKLPRRPYTVRCPWRPGGTECNTDGLFDVSGAPFKQTGTAVSDPSVGDVWGFSQVFVDAARVEADDYWKHGFIQIVKGSDIHQRRVTAFSAGEFTLDYPVPEKGEVTYTVTRGCDGSWEACQGLCAYGPSADNSANYGGFLHIKETEAG